MNNIAFDLRKFFYHLFFKWDQAIGIKPTVIILCYHSIGEDEWYHTIKSVEFSRQINYLKQNFNFISTKDLEDYLYNHKKIEKPAVVITFDDGYKDILEKKDLINSFKLKPTLFVLTNPEKANYPDLGPNKQLLSLEEMKILAEEGWIIGSHGATHTSLNKLNSQVDLCHEIEKSKEIIENTIKKPVSYFSYPKGKYTSKVYDLLKENNYILGFTMDDSIITRKTDPLLIPRIGINQSMTFEEFQATLSPSVIKFRNLIKKFLGKYI